MKALSLVTAVLFLIVSHHGLEAQSVAGQYHCSPADSLLVVELLEEAHTRGDAADRDMTDRTEPDAGRMLAAFGKSMLGKPYVAHTLELEPERLVVRLDGLDCTTFVEYSLALSRVYGSCTSNEDSDVFRSFLGALEEIRYREGRLDGYLSRLHYFCDWARDNQEKGLIRDMSAEFGGVMWSGDINFMSGHPGSYRQLEKDPGLVEQIRKAEREISLREKFYIPTDQIAAQEQHFREGDIVGICTNIPGLMIMHTGILVRIEEDWRLLHASSAEGRVMISGESLEDYLRASSRAVGIILLRPN